MTKGELIQKLAQETKFTQTQVEQIISKSFELIRASVKKGECVKIAGFGTFEKQKHKPRRIKTPKRESYVDVPSKWHPKFRPSSQFKESLK